MVEREDSRSLLETVWKDGPDVVFNLSSIYTWEKANLIPAVLEIAGVRYTGSGILGLSLARNYTRLLPLLLNSGVRVPAFAIAGGGDPRPEGLHYPLTFWRDGAQAGINLADGQALERSLAGLPAGEKALLLENVAGKRMSLFFLDRLPFPRACEPVYLKIAQKICAVMEVRGMVRLDFVSADEPILTWIDVTPDPLDETFLRTAGSAGWSEDRLLQSLVQHSGRDHE